MRCRQCEYPLWNLSARQCPECGTPFAPSEYEFMLNSIKYCCPDCGQQYYGTGKNGHLVPDEFDCVGCKRHLHMDEMVLLPAEGVSERQTEFHSTPWIDRSRRGYISSWIRMIGWSMARPKQLAEGFPVEGGLGHAFKFALSLWVIGLLLGSSIFAVLFLLLSFNLGGGFGIYELYGLFIALISGIVIGLLGTLVWGCVTHLLLMISGGSLHPLNRTLALGYLANGPMILLSIPCIGVYCFVPVAVAWAMISYSILIFYGQKVSAIRSIFSVLALPLLIGLVVGAL
ncbi:MAG: hypothetical protein CMJ32_11560, partial [Phycisphaerae bacterium]|nr:hypothetical protein [Phycisphaerae bacterium]